MSSLWTCAVTSNVKGQGNKKSRRNTKIGKEIVRATADIPHQLQGQEVKGQGHQTA